MASLFGEETGGDSGLEHPAGWQIRRTGQGLCERRDTPLLRGARRGSVPFAGSSVEGQ